MDFINKRPQSTVTYILCQVAGIMRRLLGQQEPMSLNSTSCPTFEAAQMYAPISILPDEVLIEIFAMLSDARRFPKSWHQFTHVCRHWRLVAINAARLWTTPPTKLHSCTMLFLERSRAGALDILINDETSESVVVPILDKIQRVRSLVLRSTTTSFMDYVQGVTQILGHEASGLKVLDISKKWVPRDDAVFTLLASTFPNAIQLRTLKLSSINFEWQMLPLPYLTTLSLRHMKMSSNLPWEKLLQTLAEMPLLKVMDISFHELRLHTPATLVKPIRLAHLYQLAITGATHVEISYFLARMVLPQVRMAEIDCRRGDSAQDDDYSTTIRALSSLITNGRFPVFSHISISHDRFMVPGRFDIPFEFAYPGSPNFNGGAARVIHDFLSNIAHLTDPNGRSTIKSLWLDVYLGSHQLLELFGTLPKLKSIQVLGDLAPCFIESLRIPVPHPVHEPIPFRNLEEVCFSEQEQDEDIIYRPELLQDLQYHLMQRCEYGSPVRYLWVGWKEMPFEEVPPQGDCS